MSKSFDFQFGLAEIVPSEQSDSKESRQVGIFRELVEKEVGPKIKSLEIFPSKKEIFISILQFFLSKKDYESRDIDNISKTMLDCLKNKIYVDDVQVRTLLVSKKISLRVPTNFVFVGIRELHGETDVDVVKSMVMEQAIVLYQQSTKKNL